MSKRKIAEDMPTCIADEKFRLACSLPYLWMRKARELRRAADVIWMQFHVELMAYNEGMDSPEPFTGDVAMMLYGFVVENLLKAGIASKGLAVDRAGKFNMKSHNFQELAGKFGLELSPGEDELLERLQVFVEWAGRYPTPLFANGLYPRELHHGGRAVLYGVSSLDAQLIAEILRKIECQLPSEDEAATLYMESYRAT